MSNYRTLENIIRDVAARRAPVDEQKFSLMGAIRRVGATKPKKEEPIETPKVSPDAAVEPKQTQTPKDMMAAVLDPETPEHKAHKEFVKRSLRKLHIID